MIDVYKGAKINPKNYPIYSFELSDDLDKLLCLYNLKLDEYEDVVWDKYHSKVINEMLNNKKEKISNEIIVVLNTLKFLIEKESCITLIGD